MNAQRFHLSTLMIHDIVSVPNVNVPFAHIIHSSGRADVLKPVINALGEHVGKDLIPKWVLVDDSDAEQAAVEAAHWGIKGCKVALCVWHVKRAWLLNVIKHLAGRANYAKRRALFTALQDLQATEARACAPGAHARI